MTETRDPTRWCDDSGDLPSELVRVMSDYASQGPPETELALMRAGLVQRIAPTSAPRLSRLASARSLLTLLGGLVLGAGLTTWHMRQTPGPVDTAAPAASAAPPPTQAGPSEGASTPVPTPETSVMPAAPPSPSAVHAAAAIKRRRATRRAREVESAASDPRAELELLRRARRALAAEPQRALALTDDHAQRFAEGVFAQERELIAIEALARDGSTKAARTRAARFRASYPRSAHFERLRMLLGSP